LVTLAPELLAEFDELQSTSFNWEVGIVYLDLEVMVLLNALEDVEPPPTSVPLGGIRRVSDLL
jgi:hypothetical protein